MSAPSWVMGRSSASGGGSRGGGSRARRTPHQVYAISTRVRDATSPPIRYVPAVHQRDTTPDAAAVQTAIYRRMTSDQRTRAAAEMSAMARSITLENKPGAPSAAGEQASA